MRIQINKRNMNSDEIDEVRSTYNIIEETSSTIIIDVSINELNTVKELYHAMVEINEDT